MSCQKSAALALRLFSWGEASRSASIHLLSLGARVTYITNDKLGAAIPTK
jgi:hypothetical protein